MICEFFVSHIKNTIITLHSVAPIRDGRLIMGPTLDRLEGPNYCRIMGTVNGPVSPHVVCVRVCVCVCVCVCVYVCVYVCDGPLHR